MPNPELPNPKLNVAFWDYDRTQALANGNVKIADAVATFHSAPIVTQIFEGVIRGKYNVSELGMTYFPADFQEWPVPLSWPFRCSPIALFATPLFYVSKASGITKPGDLNGKTIGELALYSHDAGHDSQGHLHGRVRVQARDLPMDHRRPRLAHEAHRFRPQYAPPPTSR